MSYAHSTSSDWLKTAATLVVIAGITCVCAPTSRASIQGPGALFNAFNAGFDTSAEQDSLEQTYRELAGTGSTAKAGTATKKQQFDPHPGDRHTPPSNQNDRQLAALLQGPSGPTTSTTSSTSVGSTAGVTLTACVAPPLLAITGGSHVEHLAAERRLSLPDASQNELLRPPQDQLIC